MSEPARRQRPGTFQSLALAFGNPRLGAVTLQSFASGLPLGLVWIAMPAWLKYRGVDIRTIGMFSLVQAPWNFKFLWSPLMDRWAPPFLGRKRSWMVITELLLLVSILLLAREALGFSLDLVFLLGFCIAFASASQDVVIDAYAVEILQREEFGKAVGARSALYRVAMYLSGGIAIWAGERLGWPVVYAGLGLLFLPMMVVVLRSPEPAVPATPPTSLRAAVFEPLLGLFKKARALEVLLFIVLYKLGENLATTLIRPFLIEKGFPPIDVGVAVTTVSVITTVGGTIVGGLLSDSIGMGRTLWISGLLQAVGSLGYVAVDRLGAPAQGAGLFELHRLVMYGAIGAEALFQGLGAGALGVLMLRLTSKKFSATQFALLSSLMGLPRVIVGPFAGVLVDAMGWTPFFIFTVPVAIPGLIMLSRFVPFGAPEARIDEEALPGELRPLRPLGLAGRSGVTFAVALAAAIGWSGFVTGLKDSRLEIRGQAAGAALRVILQHVRIRVGELLVPHGAAGWMNLAAPVIFALVLALAAAALLAARRGVARA